MSHTPKPWRYLLEIKPPQRYFTVKAGDRLVANYLAYDDHGAFAYEKSLPEHVEANARLIATAPDLLEACQDALNLLKAIGISDCSTGDVLRAAIVKATCKLDPDSAS